MTNRLLIHQIRLEQKAFWRNPEAAFFTFALPVGLLLIFGAVGQDDPVPGRPDLSGLTLFVPGILAFGIIVAAYGTLAGTVSTLRAEGVLKRIRATPLSPRVYLTGLLTSVLLTSLVVALTTVVLGAAVFDVRPQASAIPSLVGVLALGVVCFAALGVAISAAIRNPGTAGAITNGTYLPLALVSGTFSSGLVLPRWLDLVVQAFPIRALTDGLRSAYDPTAGRPAVTSVLVLVVWTIIGVALASRYFRWEPS